MADIDVDGSNSRVLNPLHSSSLQAEASESIERWLMLKDVVIPFSVVSARSFSQNVIDGAKKQNIAKFKRINITASLSIFDKLFYNFLRLQQLQLV